MKLTVAAILSSLAVVVYAQAPTNAGVAVNLPSLGQVLNAGTAFTITWTIDTNATKPSTAINSIALMKGGSANLEYYISNILTSAVPVTPPSFNWNIPSNIETNPSYVLALVGNNGATTYSTYFTIVGTSPGNTNGTSAVAPAASSTTPAVTNKSDASNSTTNSTNSGNNLMPGLFGTFGVAGAVALLL